MSDSVEDHVLGGMGSASEGEGAEEQEAVEVSAEKTTFLLGVMQLARTLWCPLAGCNST